MKKPKRFLSLILSALMLLSAVSCAESGEETETSADTADTVENPAGETTVETKEIVTDDLPEVTYDGFTYAIFTRDATSNCAMLTEELTGEALNDAIYERNSSIMERFDVVLTEEIYGTENLPVTLITAGDQTYSIMNVRMYVVTQLAQNNYCYNISDLEYIDLDKPYWDKNLTDDISIGKNRYAAIGDANLTNIDWTMVLLFNKNLVDILQIEDPYTLVNEGKWTFDKYEELAVTAISDLNGDGVMDEKDRFGMVGISKFVHCSLIQAADCLYITKDENNHPVYSMTTDEKFINVFGKIVEICNDSNAWYNMEDNSEDVYIDMFRNDRGLFLTTKIELITSLRDMESDFGIIPFPKYEESQQRYINRVSSYDTTIVPISAENSECSAVILEAINCESRNTVIPAYYDVVLKSKYARDEQSSAMLDIILSNRVIDMGDTLFLDYIRDAFVVSLFRNSDKDIVSKAAKLENTINKTIARTVKAYEEIE